MPHRVQKITVESDNLKAKHHAEKSGEKARQKKNSSKERSFWTTWTWFWCWCCRRKRGRPHYLYAFDFDHTIVNENSDAAITEVVPNPIPDHIKSLYDGTNWTEFMEYIFRYIASQGATVPVLAEKIRKLELTPEMDTVLQKCSSAINRNPKSHLVIISDANDFFISTCLLNLAPPVVPTAILSNHATISPDRKFLKIFPYEDQEECLMCPRNMCKGRALRKYIIENGPFTKIFYAGDGGNDVCPAQYLSEEDTLFVRVGFNLDRIISKGQYRGTDIKIVAKIVYFVDGKQIVDNLLF